MARPKDQEPKPAAMEMSPRGDTKSAPDTDNDDGPHHVVHLDSERASRLRKRPTRY